jgi:hypothetical protein
LLVSIKQPQPDDGGQLKGSANLGGHLAAFDALQSAARNPGTFSQLGCGHTPPGPSHPDEFAQQCGRLTAVA